MTEQSSSLSPGTRLMVIVKPSTKDEKLRTHLHSDLGIGEEGSFIELFLKKELCLKPNLGSLQKCACYIPALQEDAESVNHASTRISESFEIDRISHTKDVFREVYFQDSDNKWKSLEKWREKLNPIFRESKNIRKVTTRLNKKVDQPSEFNKILELLNVSREIAQALSNLQQEEDISQELKFQKILNALVGVDNLKQILKIWKNNQNNSSESFWQKLLSEKSFILSQLFSVPVTILESQAYVGGKGIGNKGGNVIDFLLMNKLTRNTALIEIKTPSTRLLGGEYRQGVHNVSPELSGSVLQILTSKDSLIKEYDRLVNQSLERFEVFNPQCIVIAGHAEKELSDTVRKRAFETFRSENRNVQVVTYDEVFEKIQTLVDLLEGKD